MKRILSSTPRCGRWARAANFIQQQNASEHPSAAMRASATSTSQAGSLLRRDALCDSLAGTASGRLLLDEALLSHEEALDVQFTLDDLVSPSSLDQSARAYQRAVCVPPVLLRPGAACGLERKVRQLLAELAIHQDASASAAASDGHPPDPHALAAHLVKHGLHVAVLQPPLPPPHAPLTRCIQVPFLLVAAPISAGDAAALGEVEAVLVDPALRQHLAVGPCTPAYARTLEHVPEVFVGPLPRLVELVEHMASAIQLNFTSQGLHVPPWRRGGTLILRWTAAVQQAELAAAWLRHDSHRVLPSHRHHHHHGRHHHRSHHHGQAQQQQQHHGAEVKAGRVEKSARVGDEEGQVHGGTLAGQHVGAAGPLNRVVGFTVRAGAEAAVKQGALLAAEQDGSNSSANSDVLGASPTSVFRG